MEAVPPAFTLENAEIIACCTKAAQGIRAEHTALGAELMDLAHWDVTTGCPALGSKRVWLIVCAHTTTGESRDSDLAHHCYWKIRR